jgi:hypothetical protein
MDQRTLYFFTMTFIQLPCQEAFCSMAYDRFGNRMSDDSNAVPSENSSVFVSIAAALRGDQQTHAMKQPFKLVAFQKASQNN